MSAATYEELLQPYEFESRYDMSEFEVASLANDLLDERPSNRSDKLVCYEINGSDRYSNLGRHIEATVFDDTFGNTTEVMEREYGEYEAASTFFVVMDQKKRQPVGALRIIRNSKAGLKTLKDIAGEPLNISTESFQEFHGVDDLDKCWDVGTVAVLPEYRTSSTKSVLSSSPQPNIMLYRSLYVKALNEGIDHFVAVIDAKAHRGLKLLGVPFVPINDSESFSYLDSAKSSALYGYVPEFYEKMESRFGKIQEAHPLKSKLLARPLGQLMLGKNTDEKLLLNYR